MCVCVCVCVCVSVCVQLYNLSALHQFTSNLSKSTSEGISVLRGFTHQFVESDSARHWVHAKFHNLATIPGMLLYFMYCIYIPDQYCVLHHASLQSVVTTLQKAFVGGIPTAQEVQGGRACPRDLRFQLPCSVSVRPHVWPCRCNLYGFS